MTAPCQAPTALPVYLQISENLIREIAAGRLIDGERLPPERQMAVRYGISVGTLRKALRELEKQQLLERVQGSGNYIRHQPQVTSVYSMFRLELIGGGGLPHAQILSLQRMEKPADLPEFGTTSFATRIRRLRYLNTTMVALEEIWLDGGAGEISPKKLTESLYRSYLQQLGLRIYRAEDRVGVAAVPDWRPEVFSIEASVPVGYIERHSWSTTPEAIEFSRTWFDASKAQYVQRLK